MFSFSECSLTYQVSAFLNRLVALNKIADKNHRLRGSGHIFSLAIKISRDERNKSFRVRWPESLRGYISFETKSWTQFVHVYTKSKEGGQNCGCERACPRHASKSRSIPLDQQASIMKNFQTMVFLSFKKCHSPGRVVLLTRCLLCVSKFVFYKNNERIVLYFPSTLCSQVRSKT